MNKFEKLYEVAKDIQHEIDVLKPHLDSLNDSVNGADKLLASYTEGLIGGLEICLEIIDAKNS